MPRRHHHAIHGVEAAGVHGRSVPGGGNAVCGGEAGIHANAGSYRLIFRAGSGRASEASASASGLGVGDPLHERVVGHGEGDLIRDLKDQKSAVEEKGKELKWQDFEILEPYKGGYVRLSRGGPIMVYSIRDVIVVLVFFNFHLFRSRDFAVVLNFGRNSNSKFGIGFCFQDDDVNSESNIC